MRTKQFLPLNPRYFLSRSVLVAVTVFLAFFTMVPAARADDACSDALRASLGDLYPGSLRDTLSRTTRAWACEADPARVSAVLSGASGAVIRGVPFGPAFHPEALTAWRTAHCSPRFHVAAPEAEHMAREILTSYAPDALASWSDCDNGRHDRGPRAHVTARVGLPNAAGDFVLTLTWSPGRRPAPNAVAPTFTNPLVAGATCAHLNRSLHFDAAGNSVEVQCHRVGRGRVTFTLNTSEGPVRPSPLLPAAPVSALCGPEGSPAHASLETDTMNCGGCGISCGAQGVCTAGYCTECVFGVGELTLAGSNEFPQGRAVQMPMRCRMDAGPVNASFDATVWVQAGRHSETTNFCTTPVTVGVALQLDGEVRPAAQNTAQDMTDTRCALTVHVATTAHTRLAEPGDVSTGIVVTRCEHDGNGNPCVFRDATLHIRH